MAEAIITSVPNRLPGDYGNLSGLSGTRVPGLLETDTADGEAAGADSGSARSVGTTRQSGQRVYQRGPRHRSSRLGANSVPQATQVSSTNIDPSPPAASWQNRWRGRDHRAAPDDSAGSA
jgi:hypothetical protein